MQDLPRIDQAVKSGEIAKLPALTDFIAKVKTAGGAVHVLGLISPGGVHSHQGQIAALARIVADAGVKVAVHAVLDGRDTPPKSAKGYLKQFSADTKDSEVMVATVSGRFYAMDRDKRWDRVEKAYGVLTAGTGEKAADPLAAVEAGYKRDETDEFVMPTAIGDYKGMQDGDGLLLANFRADRIREIAGALLDPKFAGFTRKHTIKFSAALGLVEYSEDLNRFVKTLFPPENLEDTFGEIVAQAGLTQLRIAETEKYAHVTFFLNGGREEPFAGEDRILVPSPKVATYDLKPQMSAVEVTDKLEAAILSGKYDLIVANYANPDMVGHTGILAAAEEAVHTIDACLGRLRAAVEKIGGVLLITADHGNVEMMRDPETGEPHTAHTTFDVPIIVAYAKDKIKLQQGRLADVAPTLLDLMGLKKPEAMSGHSLVERVKAESAV
jgi:2,3-bisphosphoglycerate-independent phosphoglycerate mutase